MKKTIIVAIAVALLTLSACDTSQQATVKNKKTTINNQQTTNNIDKIITAYLQENSEKTEETTYDVTKVTLTKDKQTYFVDLESEYLCGTGGCPLLIIAKNSDDTLAIINDFSPIQEVIVSDEIKNNWKILNILIGDGGSNETQRYSYDNKTNNYQLVEK